MQKLIQRILSKSNKIAIQIQAICVAMNEGDVIEYCIKHFNGLVVRESWGEKGVFYNPDNSLKRGVYVLNVKAKDGANDKSSMLCRENIYRINVGLRKETFIKLLGQIPSRPAAGKIVNLNYDFASLDTIIPHPVYAWMGWVSVLNPTQKTFANFAPMIEESYFYAIEKFEKMKKPSFNIMSD